MKINSLHLRLIHAWMCTKDHKCKCKQVWIDTFSHQEPALIQDSKVHSLLLVCEQQKWEGFRGESLLETDLLQVYVSTCPLCSAHSWTARIYIAKWNGTRLWFRTKFKRLTPKSLQSVSLHVIYMFVFWTQLLIIVLVTWIKEAEVFLLSIEHMSTHPLTCWHQK